MFFNIRTFPSNGSGGSQPSTHREYSETPEDCSLPSEAVGVDYPPRKHFQGLTKLSSTLPSARADEVGCGTKRWIPQLYTQKVPSLLSCHFQFKNKHCWHRSLFFKPVVLKVLTGGTHRTFEHLWRDRECDATNSGRLFSLGRSPKHAFPLSEKPSSPS